jgi:hypothetical protein
MSGNRKPLRESLIDWISFLAVNVRAGFASPLLDATAVAEAKKHIDPDFDRWVRGDPMVTGKSVNQYDDDAPGYMTRSGYGSLEIGAFDE